MWWVFCFFEEISDLSVCQIWAQICKVEIFPLWLKNFYFQKVGKKVKCFCRIARIGTFCRRNFFPKNRNFSTFFTKSKIPKIYLSGPISVAKFQQKIFSEKSGIQAVGFWAKISNFQIWNRIYSENFPLFQLFRKFRNFIHLSLQMCQVSAKSKKLFFFIHHHHRHHHSSSSSSWQD